MSRARVRLARPPAARVRRVGREGRQRPAATAATSPGALLPKQRRATSTHAQGCVSTRALLRCVSVHAVSGLRKAARAREASVRAARHETAQKAATRFAATTHPSLQQLARSLATAALRWCRPRRTLVRAGVAGAATPLKKTERVRLIHHILCRSILPATGPQRNLVARALVCIDVSSRAVMLHAAGKPPRCCAPYKPAQRLGRASHRHALNNAAGFLTRFKRSRCC
jgi:hypothetical protein